MPTMAVCEGGHESQFIETRTLTLKVSETRFTQDDEKNTNNIIDDSHSPQTSCWDFGNINSQQFKKLETSSSSSYVPPTVNKSLPNVCLELCTENLGSESGSDMSEDSADILSLLSTFHPHPRPHFYVAAANIDDEPKQSKTGEFKKKMQQQSSRSFPPPLTTMRGVNPIRVRPKREGGRLVIQAVEEPAPCTYFRKERSHGRLRLCFWDNSFGSTPDDDQELELEEEEEDEEDEEDERNCDQGLINVMEEDMIVNDGVEIGKQKFQRRSKSRYCKESGSCNNIKLVSNWEPPFWVAT